MKHRTIEKVVTKGNPGAQKSDFWYWQTKSYAERLAALKEIRSGFNKWKYGDAQPRLQRVCRITKLK